MRKLLKDILDIVIIMVVYFIVKIFIIDLSMVNGPSMYPTFNKTKNNDYVIISKYSKFTKNYNAGDIIIVKNDKTHGNTIIKRIVGIPNDSVEIKDGKVYVNEVELKEDYLKDSTYTSPNLYVKLKNNEYFALGDNREESYDCRNIGAIVTDDIIGKVLFRINFKHFQFQKF